MFDIKPFEEKMRKSISVLEEDFGTIRVRFSIRSPYLITAPPPVLTVLQPSKPLMQERL